jgi:uncharacterized membrane protein (DUF373 family)
MSALSRLNRVVLAVESTTVVALQLLTLALVVGATIVLFVLAFGAVERVTNIASVDHLLEAVQRSIAGILVVVLCLEILETLKAYFRDHYVRLEVILVVAIISISRHLVQLDLEHSEPMYLVGLSAVMLSLTAGYFLVKKALYTFPTAQPDSPNNP